MKTVPQNRFVKGLVATTTDQSQPRGSLPRLSNLLFNRRGGLETCDGSKVISLYLGGFPGGFGPWTEIFLYQPVNVARYYIGIFKAYAILQIGAITNLVVADGGAGGVLVAGTYRYVVTALDGVGGETIASNEVSFANPGAHLANLTWSAPANTSPLSYNVYRTAAGGAAGTEVFLTNTTSTSFTDDGSIAPGATAPPVSDTTQSCAFLKIPAGSYAPVFANDLLKILPADAILAIDGTPGGEGGGGGTAPGTGGGGAPPTPAGGNMGNVTPLPQIVQFANKAFIALGNGYNPLLYADTTPVDWKANNQYSLLFVIKPSVNNAGGFYFTAQIGGISSGVAPVFPQTEGSTVSDGTATWRNIGTKAVFPLFNIFTATYPDWVTATVYGAGDTIKPTVNNAGGYVFTAVQSGTTGGANPTFPQGQGQQVSDNNIIWKNIGVGATSPPPRGAAHVEIYAGSAWVANTNPVTTADNLDGPSALRMSDSNDPVSWNPLNTAFLDRDDGDQITALKAFTLAEAGIPPTGSLVVFKNFKTFQINGVFGASDFSIQLAQTDMGCIAPRSVQFLPGYGLCRLTHLGLAIFDGTRDRLISEDIRPYIFSDPLINDIIPMDWNFAYFAKGAQFADPPMYVLAVPLALNNLPLGAGAGQMQITDIGGGGAWTPGKWFFRVTRFTVLPDTTVFESDLTFEVVIIATAATRVQVIGNGIDPLAVKFRIYIGPITNGYTDYIELTPAQMAAGMTFSSLAAFPSGGSIANGIGGLTRLLCYDLVLKVWAVIDLPFPISVLKQVRAPGTQPITVTGGFNDGSVRRLQAGDPDWDGTPITWKLRTPEVYGDSATQRVFYRALHLRGVGSPSSIQIRPSYSGTADTQRQPTNYQFGNNQFHAILDLFVTALNAHADIIGTGRVETDGTDWQVEPMEKDVPMVFG